MYQSIPPHQNKYIKQAHPHPHQLSAPSFTPFNPHSQIPVQNFNPVPNQIVQASQPYQAQKLPTNGPINAQRWEDIIHQPVVNQPVVRPLEQTVTFRNNTTGKKPSNKELLAKADLILARSPPRQNTIQQTRTSNNKEQPRTSYSLHQPAQTLQTLSSPRQLHLATFTSPVRNAFEVPMSHPATINRSHVEFPPHAFVSPPREIIRSLPTEYHALPTEHHSVPQQQLFHVPPQFVGPNIIRQEIHPAFQIPHQIQHMPPAAAHERPVPLLQPAPKPGKAHHMPLESAQFPSSEFSEIRRDFVQLRLDSQPREFNEAYTPTPFRTITEEPVIRTLEFVPEITEDEDSNLENDRYGNYNNSRKNQVQRKLIAEPGYQKLQQSQPNFGKRFKTGQQSGGSSARRIPYRKDSAGSNGTNGQFARVNPESQAASSLRDTESNRRSSKSEYIEARQTLGQRARQTTPEKKSLTYGTKSENGIVRKEESLKESKIWSANSESVNLRKEDDLKDSKTWIYSPNSEVVNVKKEDSSRDGKTWIYSPRSEPVRKEESLESGTKEREAKYTNKVEVSLQTMGQKGNDKARKMMKKVEQVLM